METKTATADGRDAEIVTNAQIISLDRPAGEGEKGAE